MDIEVDGLHIQYIDQGPADPRATVLLLHGWGVDGSLYHLITDHLSGRFRVVIPDLPGFGGSQEPPVPWTPDGYADFVERFAEKLGLRDVVGMAHSNGGRILIKLMARSASPLAVQKAVLIDSAGIKPRHGPRYYLKVYTYKAAKAIFRLPGVRSLFPHAVENAQKRFGSADYAKASPLMRQCMVLALGEDMAPLLPRIAVPTLLIWGRDDTATPLADGKRMEALLPDAGLVELPGGHYAFAESFGICSRVLDSFLG